eukprot:COSAG01_NODE_1378_length_10526_cov_13.789105_8_plen_109_part_00
MRQQRANITAARREGARQGQLRWRRVAWALHQSPLSSSGSAHSTPTKSSPSLARTPTMIADVHLLTDTAAVHRLRPARMGKQKRYFLAGRTAACASSRNILASPSEPR